MSSKEARLQLTTCGVPPYSPLMMKTLQEGRFTSTVRLDQQKPLVLY